MAVAINTAWLVQDFMPQIQRDLRNVEAEGSCFQIHRVCAHATVLLHDSPSGRKLIESVKVVATREALNWQADPDEDVSDLEVLHHLQQQAATSPLGVFAQTDRSSGAATTLIATALSPSIMGETQGRPLSSFDRYAIRFSYLTPSHPMSVRAQQGRRSDLRGLVPRYPKNPLAALGFCFFGLPESQKSVVWAGGPREDRYVFWQVQVDFVDVASRRRSHKRRRTAFNPFQQVARSLIVENRDPGGRSRYNGVRHRPDRSTWVAEMKPPKHRNKQDFGNFSSEAQAARAVDAAFHHYGRAHLLNFPRTSLQFLSSRSAPAAGLDEKAKVKFVKEEAKWLASIAATTSPSSSEFHIPEMRRSPSGRYRSLPEISLPLNVSGEDVVVDTVSQRMEFRSFGECSTATAVQQSLGSGSSVQITEQGCDSPETSAPTVSLNLVNPEACEVQSKWLDSFIRSPPAPVFSTPPSPSHFQDEIAYALLEQQG